jgi:hypothetical protein
VAREEQQRPRRGGRRARGSGYGRAPLRGRGRAPRSRAPSRRRRRRRGRLAAGLAAGARRAPSGDASEGWTATARRRRCYGGV